MLKYVTNSYLWLLYLVLFFSLNEYETHAKVTSNSAHFERITTKEGLSQSTINVIVQDKNGYMWFATFGGLNKYDGYAFNVYKNIPGDSTSLNSNDVNGLLEDNNGFLWMRFGSPSGLCKLDPVTEEFTRYKQDSNNVNSISSNALHDIIQDSKGNIWISTNKAIDLYTEVIHNGVKIESFSHFDISAIEGAVTKIYENRQGDILLFANSIYKLDINTHSISNISSNIPLGVTNNVTSINEDKSGNLRLGNYFAGNSFFTYNKQTGTYNYVVDNKFSVSPEVGNFIVVDHKNRSWIGTNGNGLYMHDPQTNKILNFRNDENNENSLSDDNINVMYIDNFGILWIGTTSQGICKYDFYKKAFEHYKSVPGEDNSLNGNVISSIHSTTPGELWIGMDRGGGVDRIISLGSEQEQFIHYKNNPANQNSIGSNYTLCLVQRKNGDVWVGSAYDHVSKIIPQPPGSSRPPAIRRYNSIYWTFSIMEDLDETLWGGSWGNGIWKYIEQTNNFFYFSHNPDNPTSVCDNVIWSIFEDNMGNLWIGGHDNGLSILPVHEKNKTAPKFINYYYDENNTTSINSKTINSFCQSMDGTMWIGTMNGLYKTKANIFDTIGLKNLEFSSFHENDGLPSEGITGILEDDHGNLWLSTANGISKFNTSDTTFRNYSESDGLQSNEFWHNAYFKDMNGKMYFGGQNGFNAFYPDSIKENPFKPIVKITEIKLFNKSVKMGQSVNGDVILSKPLSETTEIELSYKNNVVTFNFVALHYARPENIEYAYKMDNFDQEWNYVDNKRDATYTNMDAGEYIFRVKATNNDGIWNETGTFLKIVVTPPYWKTWLFRIIVAIIFIGIFTSIYVIRLSSLRKQKTILEEEVKKRTLELRKTNENLKQISQFGQKITATLNYEYINKLVYDYINSFVETFDFGIGIYNSKKDVIEYRLPYEKGKRIEPYIRELSNTNSITTYCFINQKTVAINDLEAEYKNYTNFIPAFATPSIPNSLINIPLTVENKKIGVLAINSTKKKAFSETDLINLQSLAAYIAIALDNSVVHETLRESNKTLVRRQKTIEEQSEQLNETNTLLEERQQHIEEQAEELRSQAEKLNAANEDLKKLNATKDKLFSIVAHDLKNPFSTVLGFTDLLIQRWGKMEPSKIKNLIEITHSSSKKIYSLLENLLQWSRSQMRNIKISPEYLNVHNLVKENFDLLQNTMEQKGNRKEINVSEDLECFADKQTTNTVIRNILTNAIKFTENGTITVSAEMLSDFVQVSIKDTGVGIEEDKINTLFEVEKSKSTAGTKGEEGTGLGLIICKEFVEENGGKIYAQSELNVGTTIIFTLPFKPIKK